MSDRFTCAGIALVVVLATACSAPPCTCQTTTPSSAEMGPAPSPDREPAMESQAKIAARLNREGEAMLASQHYAEAAQAFRDAVSRVPEPQYFYNLAHALDGQGKYGEALTACVAAQNTSAEDSELHAHAAALAKEIQREAAATTIQLE